MNVFLSESLPLSLAICKVLRTDLVPRSPLGRDSLLSAKKNFFFRIRQLRRIIVLEKEREGRLCDGLMPAGASGNA
jgi:hypothetical protein